MTDSDNKNKEAVEFDNQMRVSTPPAISSNPSDISKDSYRHSTKDVFLGGRSTLKDDGLEDESASLFKSSLDDSTYVLSAKDPTHYPNISPEPDSSTLGSSLGSSYIMIWLSCLHQLRNEVDQQIFSAYLEPLSPIAYSLEVNEFKLSAPSKFLINQVERHFTPRITQLAAEAVENFYPEHEFLSPLKVVIVVEEVHPTLTTKSPSPGIFANRGTANNQSRDAAITMSPHRYVVVKKSVPVERNVHSNTQSSNTHLNNTLQNTPRAGENNFQSSYGQHSGVKSASYSVSPQEQFTQAIIPNASRTVDSPDKPRSYQQGGTRQPQKGSSEQLQGDIARSSGPSADSQPKVEKETEQFESGLSRRYSFTNFVVGNSNQFCHAAAMRVAENPGNSYNPLFIYGGVGLGKTHLLHSIGNSVLDKDPNAQILYMSSEAFTNELIQSLRYAKMEEFKRRLRNINVLLIDDIQFIAGKERTQEEFFHTFNALYAAKRQIVITSDRLPSDIPGIEERLQTRFSWGLTADLQAPDFETRVAILKKKGFLDGIDLPEDVAHFIAESVSSNVRELEGALTRLHAVCSIQNIPLTVKSAQSALKAILQPKIVQLSVDDIKKAVASHFGLKVTEMVSKRRTKNLSFPRHIAMYLCRKHTTASYPEIGNNFGGRDHSSVIHAASVVSSKIQSDEEVRSLITDLECQLFNN